MSVDAGRSRRATAGRVLAVLVVAGVVLAPAVGAAVGEPGGVTGTPGGVTGEPRGAGGAALQAASSTVDGTEVLHEGDELTLASAPGRAIWGRTDVPPGNRVTVRVASTDGTEPYLRSVTAVVGADGLFRAVVDVSELPPGTGLRVVVHRDGRNLTTTTGEVVACDDCPLSSPRTPSAVVVQDGANLTAEDAPGQVVTGRSNLRPGTELTVRARSSSGASPFIKQRSATVDANGSFRAVFNLDGVPEGTRFSVVVRRNDSELTSTTGWVACEDGCRTGTPDAREETPAVAPLADAEVGVVQAANRSVARLRVRLGDADAALLSVRSPTTSYALDATLHDRNDDGVVVLLFDTAAAARAGPPLEVPSGADSVVVRDERGAFAATDYRLALHPVGNESATAATGLLVVTQNASAGTPLLTTGPGGGGDLPLGSAGALLVGTLLAVVGLASLLGLLDVRDLLGGR